MKNTTTALLAAVVVLLAAHLIVQATRAAEAGSPGGGDPCPSDIDDDGMVGITDFLQLLGDWGPCPSSRVVAFSVIGLANNADMAVRVWSDNRVQFVIKTQELCWLCPDSPPSDEWTDLESPPSKMGATPIAISGTHNCEGFQGKVGCPRIYVAYSDGTTFTRDFSTDQYTDLECPPGNTLCTLFPVAPWEEFLQP